jgi:hypothetical protein
MNRRSLLLLLALLALACAGLFLVLRPAPSAQALAASDSLEPSAPVETGRETLLQAAASDEARSAGSGPGIGTPHTPSRDALGADQARIAGFLHAQEDKPWRDASVALVSVEQDGQPELLAQAHCTSYGGFTLACPRDGRALFVVCARGFAPRSEVVELARGREQLLEDLDLERGLSIEGALSSNRRPLARFEVVAVDERDLVRLQLEGGELLWNGNNFDWRYTIGESGPDGRYAIRGLRAGAYAVRVATCRGPLASLCSSERAPRTISAPRAGVDFDFESSSLALKFTSASQPLADVEVELECGSWRSGKKSDAQGQCLFELVPRLDCTFLATKAGYEELRLPVSAPASGASAAVSFEMNPKPSAAQLQILLGSANTDTPAELRLRLFPLQPLVESTPEFASDRKVVRATRESAPDLNAPPPVASLDRMLHCTSASAALAQKEFVLHDAPLGRFRALIYPGQPWNNELEPASYIGTHCVIERVIDVKPEEKLSIVASAERRGALRLDFPDEKGGHLPAHCTLRDMNGQEQPIVLVDPALGVPLLGHELSSAGPTLLYSAIEGPSVLLMVEHEGRKLYQGSCVLRRGVVQPLDLRR